MKHPCPTCGCATRICGKNTATKTYYRVCKSCNAAWKHNYGTKTWEPHTPRKSFESEADRYAARLECNRRAQQRKKHNGKPHDAHVTLWLKYNNIVTTRKPRQPAAPKPPKVPRPVRAPKDILTTQRQVVPKQVSRRKLDDIMLDRELFPKDPLF